MAQQVAVIGAGSWGTTMASVLARRHATTSWVRPAEAEIAAEINARHTNSKYLPGCALAESLGATTSLEDAAARATLIVMAVPSEWLRSVAEELGPSLREGVPVVSLTKGLEQGTHLRMTEVLSETLAGHPVGALSGPNIAKEVAAGIAAATVLAVREPHVAVELRSVFNTPRFRVYTNHDIAGVELGGALKNVIAIAAGMSDGAGGGDNTRAAIVTRGLAEITRLGVAMGGERETFAGLAGVGDLVVTCTSPHSRNRTLGAELGRGGKLDEILSRMRMVAEGVKTAQVVVELADSYGVDVPIAREINCVLHEGKSVSEAWRAIVRQEAGFEHEPG